MKWTHSLGRDIDKRHAPRRAGLRFLGFVFATWTFCCADVSAAESMVTFRTDSASFAIGPNGAIEAIDSLEPARQCLAPGRPAALLSLRFAGKLQAPDRASWDEGTKRLTLHYREPNATALVAATAKSTHLVFELLEVKSTDPVELALWGPYPIAIGETIGDIIGVVRDRDVAVGIQVLNPKTLGGFPNREDDVEQGNGGDDRGHYPNLPAELNKEQSFRGDTARATTFGSVLQAYVRQRDRERIIPNWGHEKYRAPAFNDGGVAGGKIALFACPAPQALATLGAIELAEGLPHPIIDGLWGKTSPGATASYLIVDFSEGNVDRAIEMTRRAGLRYLYHSSPFETWGHFQLKPGLFPHGWDGLRNCAKKAEAAGVRIGFHTLSNFITPNDPYVTPQPDPRLAIVGGSELATGVDGAAKEIAVENPEYFAKKSALNTARIGDELVRFGSVSAQAPWRLLDCQRGAWGTRAAVHDKGAAVARLLDHDYKVFLGDAGLSQEIARNIADLCNRTGGLQLSFDGLEGNWASGYGQYGQTLFTKAWYDALDPGIKGRVINDASGAEPFNWHIFTRMNWGEPWYAGFRESQTLYRFKNQVLFERNFMPHMLGWFALRPDTSLEDAEWLLARAAGFDAGFALATSLASTAQLAADPSSADTARKFGATSAILEALRDWETARMAGAFTPEAKARLRDNSLEFHLEPRGERRWDLYEARVSRFSRAPGVTTKTEFDYQNPAAPQPLQWIIHSTATAPVSGIRLEINGLPVVDLKDTAVPAGGNLKYTGGPEAIITDSAWKELARLRVSAEADRVPGGTSKIALDTPLPNGAALKIELRTLGPAKRCQANSDGR
jgi:hypothetical protein